MTRRDLLTPEDVAAMTDLPNDGTGPEPIRIGRRLVYRRTEVEAWLAEQEKRQGGDS